jgi:hypothetical protein
MKILSKFLDYSSVGPYNKTVGMQTSVLMSELLISRWGNRKVF